MAKTSKGIYYPYDYNKIADVPEDMKQMAESINKIFETEEIDKTTQDTKIADLQNKVIDLQQENTELANNMPWASTKGQNIHIEDSAKYSKNRLSLSGNLRQEKRSGKNKFKIPESATGYDVTLTKNEDGTFNLSGTATGNASFLAFVDLDKSGIKNGASYIFHFTKNLQAGVEFRAEMYNGTNWLRAIAPNINSTTSTSTGTANTTNATKVRFGIFVTSGTTVNIQNLGVQLEEETEGTTATEFEKYGAMPSIDYPSVPIVTNGVQTISTIGQNYFNLNDKKDVDALFTVDEDDWISVTFDNTSGTSVKYLNFYTFPSSKIKPNTNYALFLEIKNISGTGIIYTISRLAGQESQFVEKVSANFQDLSSNKIYKYAITSKADLINTDIITMLRTYIRFDARQSGSITFRISVLEDINVTAENFKYESYTENIETLDLCTTELCKIVDNNGNTVAQDKAVYREVDGVWKRQWEKKIKKLVLTGKESWNKSNTTTVAYYARNLINDVDTSTISLWGGDVVANAISNYFTMVSPAKIFANIEACCLNGPGDLVVRLGFGLNTDITTVALLQKWLAQKYTEGNPVVIYYILATPEYTDCTAEQSAVLDKLYNNFKLSKGTNNIIVESENGVGLELDLSYMQDINIKDKKLEERVTTLENLLSTTQTSAMLLDNLETDLESEV